MNYGENAMTMENAQPDEGSERSEYERLIINAFKDLQMKTNFAEVFANDKWHISHLPKSARVQPKSGIRKIIPGQKDDKNDHRHPAKVPGQPKQNLAARLRSNFIGLVNHESNLIFGQPAPYDVAYESEDEEIDTDNLHRDAAKLRQLEDDDREINPEFMFIRDGQLIFGVKEIDTEGSANISKRKPILDRSKDQAANEDVEKRTFRGFLKNPLRRNKDKNGQLATAANGTPETEEKRKSHKSNKRTGEVDMPTMETTNG